MSIPLSAATVLAKHVTLQLESIDRMYLHGYVAGLQTGGGVACFFRKHRGQPYASSALMAPISTAFVRAIEQFVAAHRIPLIPFKRGERKDTVAATYLAEVRRREGVLFVAKAQERQRVWRTTNRPNPTTAVTYPSPAPTRSVGTRVQ